MPKELTHWYIATQVAKTLQGEWALPSNLKGGHSFFKKPLPSKERGMQNSARLENLANSTLHQSPPIPATPFTTLAECVTEAPNTFLLGAVGPDFLFYYLSGSEKDKFSKAAMVLHGRDGGNTLRPLIGVVQKYIRQPFARAVTEEGAQEDFSTATLKGVGAFLMGYLVHVVSDAVFHPLVLYTVGKGSPRSRYEHHVFESALDLYVQKEWGKTPYLPTTLAELMQGMEQRKELGRREFLKLLGEVSFLGAPYSFAELVKCVKRYEKIQQWFWNPLGGWLSRGLKTLKPSLAFFEASFYQKRFYAYANAFATELSYRHPVTGIERRLRISDLVLEAVEKVMQYAPQLEAIFREWFALAAEGPSDQGEGANNSIQGLVAKLQTLQGPNLETGLWGDRADQIMYTIPTGLEGLFGSFGYRYT